jgi:YD repeat-containing protein
VYWGDAYLTVTFGYNASTDLLESVTETGGGITRKTSWTYTARRLVSSITFGDASSAHQVTNFAYDATGDLIRVSSPDGSEVSFVRDDAGNVLTESTKAGTTTRRWIERLFDSYNRVDRVIGANNAVDFDYHPDGTLRTVSNGRGHVTEFSYDDFKRLTRTLQPGAIETTYGYDVADRLVSTTDANLGTSAR